MFFYKTNKLMLRYSYVITSLPKKVQVYNNTTTSSTATAYTLAGRGTRLLLLATPQFVLGSLGLWH